MNSSIKLDVLIIGGGVMGLWLLNDLRRAGYHALLLERQELGAHQTCHSHVYIHKGFLYNKALLAEKLKGVSGVWSTLLKRHPALTRSTISYFGFRHETDFTNKCLLWRLPTLALDFTTVTRPAWPDALKEAYGKQSAVKILVTSPEHCLDGNLLVAELARPVRDSLIAVREISEIRLNPGGDRIQEVLALNGGTSGGVLRFHPSAVVFAAGAGNLRLLQQARARMPKGGAVPQQIRKAHMLVIRGSRKELPALTGVFPSIGALFLVSSELADENVWLVSDNRSEPMNSVGDWITYDARWWLPPVIAGIEELAPIVFGKRDNFRWSVYEAPKAEGSSSGVLPEEERILRCNLINLWTVWPTKLTLSPKASETIVEEMRNAKILASGIGAHHRAHGCTCPGVAPERWTQMPPIPWQDFRRAYHL